MYSRYIVETSIILTAISLHADIEIPVPSICFKAYSLPSVLKFKSEKYFGSEKAISKFQFNLGYLDVEEKTIL